MSLLKELEAKITAAAQNAGLPIYQTKLMVASNPKFGEYQINDAFKIAKETSKLPMEIASSLKEVITTLDLFSDVNVTSPGFVNLTIKEDAVIKYFNQTKTDPILQIDKENEKTILLDYGGPNASKALHVGHMRSANIGEAIKRLLKVLGINVISDIHIGDNGTPAGMVLVEMERRNPNLAFFKIVSPYPNEIPFSLTDLKTIYPEGSKRAKEDDRVMQKAKLYAKLLQDGHPGLKKLWHLFMELSIKEIKDVYQDLNVDFDLWESETDSFEYFDEMNRVLDEKNLVKLSDGAQVIDVTEAGDTKELPPFILYKSDGAALYSTTDLATIVGRIKRFAIDEMWYLTDKRQALHFKQLFRVSNKAGFTSNIELVHIGFGTMNNVDGKPFKTRDGGVLPLAELLDDVKAKTKTKLSERILLNVEDQINHQVAISVIKYADLLPVCTTDYIFDVEKFSDTEGKTGPYLLYSTVRIKSLLKKAHDQSITFDEIKVLKGDSDYQILITLLNLPTVLSNSYRNKTLNEICEYLYKLNANYNTFYAGYQILSEADKDLRESWLALSKLVLKTNLFLLDILAIEVPEQM